MKKALWPALAGVVLLATVIYGWYYFPRGGRPSPDDLQQQALSAATPQEQQAAAAQLCDWGEAALPQLRRVLEASELPEVRVMIIQTLGNLYDFDSMDLLLSALSDPSPEVRQRSILELRRMLGYVAAFDPNGPEAQRQKAIDLIRKDWETLKGSSELKEFKQRIEDGTAFPPEPRS
jgi:HEAT repeat protein